MKRLGLLLAVLFLSNGWAENKGSTLTFQRTEVTSPLKIGSRPRVTPYTMIYARIQPYDLYGNYLEEWIDRPLYHNREFRDSAAGQRTLASAKSVSELFYERGILVNPRVDKDLFSGIARVKSYLSRKNGLPDLYIFSCCTNMIREIKGYFWGKGDSPEKRDDHAMDELRYYLMTRPKNAVPPQEESEIARDKMRRIRKLRRRPNG